MHPDDRVNISCELLRHLSLNTSETTRTSFKNVSYHADGPTLVSGGQGDSGGVTGEITTFVIVTLMDVFMGTSEQFPAQFLATTTSF